MHTQRRRWRSTSVMDQYSSGLVTIDRQPQRNTLRSFGLALALLCIARGAWSWTNNAYTFATVSSCVGVALASIALVRPSTFRWPYVLFGVLSYPLRWLLSCVVLAIVYFAVITPIACGVRLARRLRAREGARARAGEAKPRSHWRVSPARGDKPSYFRQF